MEDFVYRVKIKDALNWHLHGTLRWELIDEAIRCAPQTIRDNEKPVMLDVVDDEFVVVCPA